ncbi:FecR domain-containing protein [Draconibacterium sp. IB214405]|uniref:FecR family protein n=1 Tax=Draconibacterium sp. IB214405 TaxID=3097352 RepID=UPI002A0FA394|nr:FecR domain-containing protein [Draconibacterium sp. IB214405]MDX8339463.1 FecR domain-containing protein [Draconibacterium sp. IB214405]
MNDKNTENTDKAILHFIQGNADDKEKAAVLKWLNENPENRKKLFKQKDLWNAAEIDSDRLKELENTEWLALQNRIETSKVRRGFFKELIKIAAIVVVALGVGWISHYFYTDSVSTRKVEMRTVEAIKGQIKEVFLADGTHVWLNAGSQLSFPSDFTEKNREISLHGEAYFEVTSSEKNPFLVKTGNHTVKVTGTKFNICEYPEDKMIETTLVEGKVKIISGNFFKDLYPGEQATFYTETAEVLIGEKDFDIYTAWREGRYEFRNESVDKVFQIMERWWDVEIDYSKEEFKYEYISGVLRKHKPIKQHFEVINELVPIDYKIDDDNITVKLK